MLAKLYHCQIKLQLCLKFANHITNVIIPGDLAHYYCTAMLNGFEEKMEWPQSPLTSYTNETQLNHNSSCTTTTYINVSWILLCDHINSRPSKVLNQGNNAIPQERFRGYHTKVIGKVERTLR